MFHILLFAGQYCHITVSVNCAIVGYCCYCYCYCMFLLLLQYGAVSSDALPLLTSSAWSAVIHRPADEDSEPDDLPSTVDMDAIKVCVVWV